MIELLPNGLLDKKYVITEKSKDGRMCCLQIVYDPELYDENGIMRQDIVRYLYETVDHVKTYMTEYGVTVMNASLTTTGKLRLVHTNYPPELAAYIHELYFPSWISSDFVSGFTSTKAKQMVEKLCETFANYKTRTNVEGIIMCYLDVNSGLEAAVYDSKKNPEKLVINMLDNLQKIRPKDFHFKERIKIRDKK